MKTLRRSIGRPEVGGEPLPPAFQVFQLHGIVLRRAEVSVIAGTPGAGKSTLALHIAARLKQPTLYFSADTNAHTMAMRLISLTADVTQAEAERILQRDRDKAERYLQQTTHLFWSFEPTPSLKDLDEEVAAFETAWGRSPTLIVVDNLMDIAMDGHEEFSGMRAAMKELKYLARDTNACVLVLHHTKEGFDGYPCQPRSAIQGMVNQIPAMILTVGQMQVDQQLYLCTAPVKNRYGKADHTGKTHVMLNFDPAKMYLEDIVRDYRQDQYEFQSQGEGE